MNAVLDGAANAAATGVSAHALGDTADSATAVVTAPEPGAPAPPAAAAQPPPAGPTAQETPALDSGGDALAAVAAAAELLKSKEAADSRAAAELAELKKSNHEEPGGAGDAGGAGNGKPPSGTRPKPQTDMEKEEALLDKLRSIPVRVNELLKHDPTTPDYLLDVVRLHCAFPASGACCGAILTMFRCHGRAQVALEHNIASIISDIDKPKQSECRAFIKQLYDRVPPPPKPPLKVPDDTSNNFGKLLGKLASAATVADIHTTEVLEAAMCEIEMFVLGAVTSRPLPSSAEQL